MFLGKKKINSFIAITLCGVFLLQLFFPFTRAQAAPLLANYYLAWDLNEKQVQELAKWDLVVVDMENQARNPDMLRRLRQLNPKIKIFAYLSANEIGKDPNEMGNSMRKKLAAGIDPQWYLKDAQGQNMSFWPTNYMLNITPKAATINGFKANKYIAHFVADEVLSTGLWDGVFYDGSWGGVNWFGKNQIDLDGDGVADRDVDEQWRAGMRFLYNETRLASNNKYLVLTNIGSGHKEYRDQIDGFLIETFPEFGWNYTMQVYDYQANGGPKPRFPIINSNSHNTGNQYDYREMRYGLASALMHNGYFSFDHGTNDHTQTWWYDEYGIKLGEPLGSVSPVVSKAKYDEQTVWRREFTNGIALINPSVQSRSVDLGSDYEKINGTQDRSVNNGQITGQVQIGPKDGIVMIRTLQKVNNTVFANGSFLRFFNERGTRSRNGIFAYEDGVDGGASVYRGDLNNDGQEERVVVQGAKIEFFNRDGQSISSDYPYGANYTGGITMAVGRLSANDPLSVIVAPKSGNSLIVYNYIGQKIRADWQPLGAQYQGGFSVALGDITGDGQGEVVVGVGRGRISEVLVFNNKMDTPILRFTPYDKFSGGVSVALADVNGDRTKEIITYPLSGADPIVRTFNGSGKKAAEFRTRGILGSTQATLGAADVNSDGKDEIVLMGAQ